MQAFPIVVLLAAAVPPGMAAAGTEDLPPWGVVATPNQGNLDNALKAIAGAAENDLWAVGEYNPGIPPTATGRRTLIEHWDGSQWTIVSSPNPSWPGMDYATLESVGRAVATSAWAVGYSEDFSTLRLNTLILHWDGSQWTIVPSPNPAGLNQPNQLFAVTGESAHDLWAVGMSGLYPDEAPLILRRGADPRWRVVPNDCSSPQTLGYKGLNAVFSIASNDVWAAGDAALCHWDGQDWSVVPSPQPRPEYLEIAYPLLDLSGTGPNDVWAVGARIIDNGQYLAWSTLIEHWDGTGWTAFYLPGEFMSGVAAVAPDDVWAVGTDGALPLILHYDGGSWSVGAGAPAPRSGRPDGGRAFAGGTERLGRRPELRERRGQPDLRDPRAEHDGRERLGQHRRVRRRGELVRAGVRIHPDRRRRRLCRRRPRARRLLLHRAVRRLRARFRTGHGAGRDDGDGGPHHRLPVTRTQRRRCAAGFRGAGGRIGSSRAA
jgi:hypothetical protein